MDKFDKELLVCLLEISSQEFGCHSCNELDEKQKKIFKKWPKEKKKQFFKILTDWNNDREIKFKTLDEISDWMLFEYFIYKIKGEIIWN